MASVSSTLALALSHLTLEPPTSGIIILQRGRDSTLPNSYTHSEIAFFLLLLEIMLPATPAGWKDLVHLCNENSSVERPRNLGNLVFLYRWVSLSY